MNPVTCQRCHRKLTGATSVARGYGVECWRKVKPPSVDLPPYRRERLSPVPVAADQIALFPEDVVA